MSERRREKAGEAADRAVCSLDRLITKTLEAADEAKRTRTALLRLAKHRRTKGADDDE